MIPLSGHILRVAKALYLILIFAFAIDARSEIWLTSYTFSLQNMPYIQADAADMAQIQAAMGAGGYYKLRAKVLVTHDPGYFHAIDTANNNGGRLTHIPGPGNYVVQLYYAAYTASGALTLGTFYSKNITIIGGGANGTSGLSPSYFDNKTLSGSPVAPAPGQPPLPPEAPNGAWASAGPQISGIGTDNFSIRWEGLIETTVGGQYTFTTGSDDGMRVFITDMQTQLAGSWSEHAYSEASGSILLGADTRYNVKVEFFEAQGEATAKLFWTPPTGGQRQIVPITRFFPPDAPNPTPAAPAFVIQPGALDISSGANATFYVIASGYPSPTYQWRINGQAIAGATSSTYTITMAQPTASGNYDVVATNSVGIATSAGATLVVNPGAQPGNGEGLRGAYYSGEFGHLVTSRIDPTIEFGWGFGSPASGVPSDYFSAKWFGYVEAPDSGRFTFTVNVDDGARLLVNGSKILDAWTAGSGTYNSTAVYLPAGVKVPIEMHYRENERHAGAELKWSWPAKPNSVVVPRDRLYPGVLQEATWQLDYFTQSGQLEFFEDIGEDENGNLGGLGSYSSSVVLHQFSTQTGGTVRIYTSGSANTEAWFVFADTYGSSSYIADHNGGNFKAEYNIAAGNHRIEVYGSYQDLAEEDYVIHIDFKPAAGPAPSEIPPTITSDLEAFGKVGQSFTSYTITTQGQGQILYYASNLPPGLAANASSGAITGTPTAPGTYPNVIVSAANAGGVTSRVVSMFIAPADGPPVINSASEAGATVGAGFIYEITTANGLATFAVSGLPAGLGYANGRITGSPTTAGTFAVTITATNSQGTSAPFTLMLRVAASGIPVINLFEPFGAVRQP